MAWVVFPHQLFGQFRRVVGGPIVVLEDPLFYSPQSVSPQRSFRFSKLKVAFHRATTTLFINELQRAGFADIRRIDYQTASTQSYPSLLAGTKCQVYDPVDHLLRQKVREAGWDVLESPNFLYPLEELKDYARQVRRPYFQTSFYKYFREKRGWLMSSSGEYAGGKLSFDTLNRMPLPKGTPLPAALVEMTQEEQEAWGEAMEFVERHFPDNPGSLEQVSPENGRRFFPISRRGALLQLDQFMKEGLHKFGPYQDAFCDICVDYGSALNDSQVSKNILFHSTLSGSLNCGLLDPREVIERALQEKAPIESLEAFLRQVGGWREYVRFIYEFKGQEMRQSVHFTTSTRKLSSAWYRGDLGVPPVDDAIRTAFTLGYLHHILRLMVVANFMTLCNIQPKEMYGWFMSFSLDAYDWVMVPNVYGMASYASDVMSTKPYISSSHYLLRMSNYSKASWCDLWDALYYNFLSINEEVLRKNARMAFMYANLKKKDPKLLEEMNRKATHFLKTISAQ